MDDLSYALLKPMIPFLAVMTLAVIGWVLSEAAARRLSGSERTIWAFAMLVFPPLGSILYGLTGKKNATDAEAGRSC